MTKVRPPARLEPCPGDLAISLEQLEQLTLFAGLKEKVDPAEFPGALVLRRFQKGEIVCRAGEPGWTAFYILRRQDVESLHPDPATRPADPAEPRRVARVYSAARRPTGLWERLRNLGRGPDRSPPVQESSLVEGELFGEMSCLYRTPRTATVEVTEDCTMLEMMRHILDKMLTNRNRAFKDQVDAVYRQRVLEFQFRALPLFRALPAAQLETLRTSAELLSLEPGELLCDENDLSDRMFIIRSGFVKVEKGATYLLATDQIANWPAFCAALHAGAQQPGPARKVWDLLPEDPVRAAIAAAASGGELNEVAKQAIVTAVNAVLKNPKLAKDLAEAVDRAGLAALAKKLPGSIKKWENYQEVVGFNRRLVQALYPGVLPRIPVPDEDSRVLSYRSVGDFIGEMSLMTGKPRNATCIAYDHAGSKFGRVELVRVRKEVFEGLVGASAELKAGVTALVLQREAEIRARMAQRPWDERSPTFASERFDELGLIQGQKLMLIDLDRCTRCDECVKACVATHPEDQKSRLFLDGPVFRDASDGRMRNYLVPATCRQCRDPVCLIGCPVGSIHKGENAQIAIEDWCIGCSRCAEQCPYNAIQMYALGVLPRRSHGWSYRSVGEEAAGWIAGQAPFRYDRAFRECLRGEGDIEFRHTFELGRETPETAFQLQVLSLAPAATVSINGSVVLTKEAGQVLPLKKDKGESWNLEARLALGPAGPAGAPDVQKVLRPGRNLVTVRLTPPADGTEVLLELGIYRQSKPVVAEGTTNDLTQEVVMNRAVVCDLCSEQFGQRPACVNACPHDAALRVDARTWFPQRVPGSLR
jgi:Fe-S-cluster-containing dehydrogenase component